MGSGINTVTNNGVNKIVRFTTVEISIVNLTRFRVVPEARC